MGSRRARCAALGIAVGAVLCLGSCASGHESPPPVRPNGSTSLPSPTATQPSTPAADEPACTSAQLKASDGGAGDAAGTEITHLLFTDIGTSPCWFGGVPTLFGVTAAGAATKLPFTGTADAADALQPKEGPGMLGVGDQGLVIATMQLNNCPTPASRFDPYQSLRVQFPNGGATVTLPYPKSLKVTGCPGQVSQAGPGNSS